MPVAADEGIVGRRRAIPREAQDLAEVRAHVLRRGLVVEAVADGEQQRAVRQEQQAAAGVARPRLVGRRAEDHAPVHEPAALVARAPDGRAIGLRVAFREREEQRAVAREVRVERDVEQAAVRLREHARRPARERLRQELAVTHDPQAAILFGDEDLALGREGEAPRPLQSRDPPFEPRRALDDGTRGRARDRLFARRRLGRIQGERQAGENREDRFRHRGGTPGRTGPLG